MCIITFSFNLKKNKVNNENHDIGIIAKGQIKKRNPTKRAYKPDTTFQKYYYIRTMCTNSYKISIYYNFI